MRKYGLMLLMAAMMGTSTGPVCGAEFVIRGGRTWGMHVTENAHKDFASPRSMGRADFDISRWEDAQNIERFCEGQCDILVYCRVLDQQETDRRGARPATFVVAYAKVAETAKDFAKFVVTCGSSEAMGEEHNI